MRNSTITEDFGAKIFDYGFTFYSLIYLELSMQYFARLLVVIFTVAFAGGAASVAVSFPYVGDCLEGSGSIVNYTLNIGNCSGIKTVGLMKVYITQGDNPSLRIKADDNIISRLEPKVVNGNLTFNDAVCYLPSRPIEVYVTMKHVKHLSMNGAGEIIGQTPVSTPEIILNISGSGDIRLQVEAENIEANVNGSGSITLNGTAVNVDANIQGSGYIHGYGLNSVNSKIAVVGSGNAEATVMNILEATIAGSGDIYYKGSPETIKKTITGSGSLKKRS